MKTCGWSVSFGTLRAREPRLRASLGATRGRRPSNIWRHNSGSDRRTPGLTDRLAKWTRFVWTSMSCLGGLTLHQYCHGDNRQAMTSQLPSSWITHCRNLTFGSWQWRSSLQVWLTPSCGDIWENKVYPIVMWWILICYWVTPNSYTAHLMNKEKTFSAQSGCQATRIMYVYSYYKSVRMYTQVKHISRLLCALHFPVPSILVPLSY